MESFRNNPDGCIDSHYPDQSVHINKTSAEVLTLLTDFLVSRLQPRVKTVQNTSSLGFYLGKNHSVCHRPESKSTKVKEPYTSDVNVLCPVSTLFWLKNDESNDHRVFFSLQEGCRPNQKHASVHAL